jgi:hypothetical protein
MYQRNKNLCMCQACKSEPESGGGNLLMVHVDQEDIRKGVGAREVTWNMVWGRQHTAQGTNHAIEAA